MRPYRQDLEDITRDARQLQQVRKAELQRGDRVIVKTNNSVYAIRVVRDELYIVSGGWFDRKGLSPVKMNIKGCTWGGSTIKVDILAACGLRMEFGNRLITSAIRKIMVIPHSTEN
jgi:hypothetical protein